MGQLQISDTSLPDLDIVNKLYNITTSRKVTSIMEQNESLLVMYDDDRSKFDRNSNITVIPDKLFIKSKNEIYITHNIELQLQWFNQILEIIANKFPHLEEFIKMDQLFSVNIKPCIKVTNQNAHRLDEELNDYHKAIGFLENRENQDQLNTYVLGEIIRKLYKGEDDLMNGFLIYRSQFKYLKSIVDEKTEAQMLIDKLDESPNVVDLDNFFFGSAGKFYFKILGNIVFYTPKKTTYFNFLDLKYLAILDTLGNLLNQKKFGRD